jgi:hypothetical protein
MAGLSSPDSPGSRQCGGEGGAPRRRVSLLPPGSPPSMSDDPIIETAPLPLRRAAPEASPPPESVVRELHASLRATEVYVGVLIDRIELARTSGLVQLDGVPADVFVKLIGISNTLQTGAGSALTHLDRDLAGKVQAVAALAYESARTAR